MYGYIYLTTNIINNTKYIGKHMSEVFDESYKGSGKLLKRAIDKYGWDNFYCEILEWCESEEVLNLKEDYYITKFNAVESDEYYNIAEGGHGGFVTAGLSEDERQLKGDRISKKLTGKPKSSSHKKAMSDARKHKKLSAGENNPMYGVHRCGDSAPTYGYHWYNNGIEEIYVKEDLFLSDYKDVGFRKGMLTNHKYKNK